MSKVKFYQCETCGNLITMINDSGVNPVCCGNDMTLLEANTTDAAVEKHVPVVSQNGDIVVVEVGSVPHPMTEEHLIQWIYLETTSGGQLHLLNPGDEPKATFALSGDSVVTAYEYCNLHGLWKKEM